MAYITPPASKTRIWDGYSGQETRDELMKRSKKMKAAGHGERLVQITRYPRFFPVSVYLVREDDGFTLINTGLRGSGREILEVAGRYGGQVRRIALTHAHADHTGSLDALREALPEAEVLMTAREARFLGGGLVLEQGSRASCAAPGVLRRRGPRASALSGTRSGRSRSWPRRVTRRGTYPSWTSGTGRSSPATPSRRGPVLRYPASSGLSSHSRLSPPGTRRPRSGGRALRELGPSRLAVGHGPVLEDPLPAMDRAIEVAGRKVGDLSLRGARGVA